MGIIALLIGAVIYFIPSIIAGRRNHNNFGSIVALNILLGWTAIGWIICLVWSLSDNIKK